MWQEKVTSIAEHGNLAFLTHFEILKRISSTFRTITLQMTNGDGEHRKSSLMDWKSHFCQSNKGNLIEQVAEITDSSRQGHLIGQVKAKKSCQILFLANHH